jgi:hypothetical protein
MNAKDLFNQVVELNKLSSEELRKEIISKAEELKKLRGEEYDLIGQIAARAADLAKQVGVDYKVLDAFMDVDKVHGKYTLRLRELLEADNSQFAHDVFGIATHLNRSSGELENFWTPRYAVQELPEIAEARRQPITGRTVEGQPFEVTFEGYDYRCNICFAPFTWPNELYTAEQVCPNHV